MNTVATVLVLVLVAAMLFLAVRYGLRYFHGTFSAWGDKHYQQMSGTDDDKRR